MTKTLERAKMHFEPQLKNPKAIEIPEWGDEENGGVFYATALNLLERRAIEAKSKDDIDLSVEIILAKLTDADGAKAFDRKDKQTMMTKLDPRVISRVALEILGEAVEVDEAEKN